MDLKNTTIGVVGMWHLGCVIAASWTKLGARAVIGSDYDAKRIANLASAIPPIHEPGLPEVLADGIKRGTLQFASEVSPLSACDVVFVAYDTPVREDDSCDTSIIERAVADLAPILKDNAIVIVSSQVPAGLCRKLRASLQLANGTLELLYSPENLRLGEAISCYLQPGRIILGGETPEAIGRARSLFAPIDAEVISMNLESAEIVKHGINAFLALSIVYGNSLGDICERVGGRMDDVVKGLRSDPRIGNRAYISPGTGFSGGTLGRDLVSLDAQYQSVTKGENLFRTVYDLNQARTKRFIERIGTLCSGVRGKRLGVLGLTYKAGTSTMRRSMPLEIATALAKQGAQVFAYDPKADFAELEEAPPFIRAKSAAEVAVGAEMLLLLTEWPEFRELRWSEIAASMKTPVIFDLKNFLSEISMTEAGITYHSVGRGKATPQKHGNTE